MPRKGWTEQMEQDDAAKATAKVIELNGGKTFKDSPMSKLYVKGTYESCDPNGKPYYIIGAETGMCRCGHCGLPASKTGTKGYQGLGDDATSKGDMARDARAGYKPALMCLFIACGYATAMTKLNSAATGPRLTSGLLNDALEAEKKLPERK